MRVRLEAIACRLEASASRLEAIAAKVYGCDGAMQKMDQMDIATSFSRSSNQLLSHETLCGGNKNKRNRMS